MKDGGSFRGADLFHMIPISSFFILHVFPILRAQRFGNDMLAAEPFAEIKQFAGLRTKWGPWCGKPVTALSARRARKVRIRFHVAGRQPVCESGSCS